MKMPRSYPCMKCIKDIEILIKCPFAELTCETCQVQYTTTISPLQEECDVYFKWFDMCVELEATKRVLSKRSILYLIPIQYVHSKCKRR